MQQIFPLFFLIRIFLFNELLLERSLDHLQSIKSNISPLLLIFNLNQKNLMTFS